MVGGLSLTNLGGLRGKNIEMLNIGKNANSRIDISIFRPDSDCAGSNTEFLDRDVI